MDTKPANFIDKTQEMANDRKIYFLNFGRTSPLYRSQNNIIWKTTNKATTTPPPPKENTLHCYLCGWSFGWLNNIHPWGYFFFK